MLSYVRYVPQLSYQSVHDNVYIIYTWSPQISVYVLSNMFGFFTALNSRLYCNNNFRPIKTERVV